ncbi:MAG: hypothetical protein WC563_15285 [Brevundimonas sp.]
MKHWLSFADGNLPTGSQFLGAVVVEAPSFLAAVAESHRLGINPGGEVQGVEVPRAITIPPAYVNRILTRAECEALDRELEVKPS